MKVKYANVVDEDRHHRPLPPSHMLSRLNSDFSFNNDDLDLEAHLFKPDAIHRSVSREAWYKVSHTLYARVLLEGGNSSSSCSFEAVALGLSGMAFEP
jgi:hypothetical protein